MQISNFALNQLDNLHSFSNTVSTSFNSDGVVLVGVLEDAKSIAKILAYLTSSSYLNFVFKRLFLCFLNFSVVFHFKL